VPRNIPRDHSLFSHPDNLLFVRIEMAAALAFNNKPALGAALYTHRSSPDFALLPSLLPAALALPLASRPG
jgi:hypothetical protein